jgi:uncharacterized protein YdhG (YjbR/CyaY superfamily)
MKNLVDEYIAQFPKEIQATLNELRQIILKTAPNATESIAYKMPTYKLNNKPLIYFAGHSKHIGLYPMPSVINEFKNKLSGFKQTGKGTLQIPYNLPLPVKLIEQIVKYRINEIKNAN